MIVALPGLFSYLFFWWHCLNFSLTLFVMRTTKIVIKLRGYAGRFESSSVAHFRGHVFPRYGSDVFYEVW